MSRPACGCDCVSLFSPEQVAESPLGSPDFWDSGAVTAYGESYGITLEATNALANHDAKSSGVTQVLKCEIDSIGGIVAKCSISRDNGAIATGFSAPTSTDTITLSNQSRRVIRQSNSFDLRLDACAVGPNVLLTASSQNLFAAHVEATPMQLDGRRGVYRDWESWISNPYTKTPPPGVTGYEASEYEIYRNGQKISAFASPAAGSLTVKILDGAPCLSVSSNAGNPSDRVVVQRLNEKSPWLIENEGSLPGGLVTAKAWAISATSSIKGHIVWRVVKRGTGVEPWGFEAGAVRHERLCAVEVNAGESVTIIGVEGVESHQDFASGVIEEEIRTEIPFLYVVPMMRSHPFPTGVLSQCAQEGEYLIVAKQGGENALDMVGPRQSVFEDFSDQVTARTAQPLISYGSFVVRNSKYAYAVTQFDDVFADELLNQKPTWFYRENPWVERIGVTGPHYVGGAGQTLQASCYPQALDDVTQYGGGAHAQPGNAPLHSGTNVQFTTFAIPANGKRGARPRFVGWSSESGDSPNEPYGGVQSQPYVRNDLSVWPVFASPATSLVVRFDKPVTGVTASMLSVHGHSPPDGSAASVLVVSVRRVGDSLTDYKFVLSGSPQVPNSQWTATFTPTAEIGVLSKQMLVRVARDGLQEPGEMGVLYLDANDGTDWIWDGVQFSRPSQNDCEEFGTTKLSCRFMWCIARTSHYAQETGTDSIRTMPSRSSVSDELATTKSHSGEILASATPAGVTVFREPATKATILSDSGLCSFVPRLPSDQSTKTSTPFSYFGVPTTIHPSEPRLLGGCLAPSESQPHASLIFGSGAVSSFLVTLPELIGINGDGVFSPGKPLLSPEVDGNSPAWQFSPNQLRVGGAFTLQASNQPQNFWASSKVGVNWQAIRRTLGVWSAYSGVVVRHDRVVVDHAIVRMAASRGRLTYRAMQTTAVTELVLTLSVEYFGKTDYRLRTGGNAADFGEWQGAAEFTRMATATIIVPPHKEANLGQLEDLNGRTWNIVRP